MRSRQVVQKAKEFARMLPELLVGFSPLEQARILKLAAVRVSMEQDTVGSKYKVAFDGQYRVYDDGRIFSVRSTRFLKGSISNGYRSYYIDGKNRMGHIIVADAFLPNPDNLPLVNHLNEIRDDNRVENLERVGYSENVQYSQGKHIYTDIHCYNKKGVLLKVYKNLKECEKDGLKKEGVKEVCRKDKEKRYYKQMVFSLKPMGKEWFDNLPNGYFDDRRSVRKELPLLETINEIAESGKKITINAISDSLGVTRQTVYNHLSPELKEKISFLNKTR